MIYFFDSSAFAKAFIEEEGSDSVGRLLTSLEPSGKVVSVLARLEVRSAIRRYQRLGSLSSASAETILALLIEELSQIQEYPLSEGVIHTAARMVDRHGLRTLDALQLATADVVRQKGFPGL